MSKPIEFCGSGGCIETVRSGDHYYLLDTKDRSLGPLAVWSAFTYQEHIENAYMFADPTLMFDNPAQHASIANEEMDAYGTYIRLGRLHELADGASETAFSDLRTIVADNEPVL